MSSFKAPLPFSSPSGETTIQRSSHFIGHLNKNWVMQNLPRYMLALTNWKNNLKASSFGLFEESISSSITSVKATQTNTCDFESKKALCTSNKTVNKSWKYNQNSFEYQSNSHCFSILNSLTLDKIVLHSTSGKLYQSPKSSCLLDLTFSTLSCQTPTKVYSRKAIAAFKLSKLTLLGVKTTLRNTLKDEFFYKFYFLQATEHSSFILKLQSQPRPKSLFPSAFAPLKSFRFQNSLKFQNKKLLPPFCFPRKKNSKAFLEEKLNQQSLVYNYSYNSKKNIKKLYSTSAIAIKNVFIFNELDSLDYDFFSNLAGFEIMLISRKLV